jgi:hypothetical protein
MIVSDNFVTILDDGSERVKTFEYELMGIGINYDNEPVLSYTVNIHGLMCTGSFTLEQGDDDLDIEMLVAKYIIPDVKQRFIN